MGAWRTDDGESRAGSLRAGGLRSLETFGGVARTGESGSPLEGEHSLSIGAKPEAGATGPDSGIPVGTTTGECRARYCSRVKPEVDFLGEWPMADGAGA